MQSPVLLDFIERGERRRAREDILQVLSVRFGAVPENLASRINQLGDLDVLRRIHLEAVRSISLDDFRQAVGELVAQQ